MGVRDTRHRLRHATNHREFVHVSRRFFEQIRYLNTRDIAGNRFEWAPVLNGRVRLGIPSVDMRHAALLGNHEHILRGSFSPRGAQDEFLKEANPTAPKPMKFAYTSS